MIVALALRSDLEVNVLRDRNPVYVKLSDGGVRNGYTVKLLNKLYQPQSFSIGLQGLPGAKLSVIGHEQEESPAVVVPPDDLQSLRLYVTLDKEALEALQDPVSDFSFVITDKGTGASTLHKATFRGPGA
jgi:polyferredoxin